VSDSEGLGGKPSDTDKKTATSEELDEKLDEVQAIVQPITSKHYEGTGGEEPPSHDVLYTVLILLAGWESDTDLYLYLTDNIDG
jgi:hypothetical protein